MYSPGRMQVTVVAHYGQKSAPMADFIRRCQNELAKGLLAAFRPYEVDQVHATLMGLEGYRWHDGIVNRNFLERRNERRQMNLAAAIAFLQSGSLPAIHIRIGGYKPDVDYGFTSQGQHPYLRSFSVHGEIAVAMGWPIAGDPILDRLRRQFNKMNIWHKRHDTEVDIDNDFYFVLGRIDRRVVTDKQVIAVEDNLRQLLVATDPITIEMGRSSLSIVGYLDKQLPMTTSCAFPIDGAVIDAALLRDLYPEESAN